MEALRQTEQGGQRRTSGRDLPAVITFLQNSLANGRVAIEELEVKGRAAGLLRENQRITHAKLFKTAKKQIGICSVREGFGPQGQWFWSLPCAAPAEAAHQSEQTTHGATCEYKDTTPDAANAGIYEPERATVLSWRRLIDRLPMGRPPAGIPRHRWLVFLGDCAAFLTSSNGCAEKAAGRGWTTQDLFAWPAEWGDPVGLLWVIAGGSVIELHDDWAMIEAAGSRRHLVFGRPSKAASEARLQRDNSDGEDPGW